MSEADPVSLEIGKKFPFRRFRRVICLRSRLFPVISRQIFHKIAFPFHRPYISFGQQLFVSICHRDHTYIQMACQAPLGRKFFPLLQLSLQNVPADALIKIFIDRLISSVIDIVRQQFPSYLPICPLCPFRTYCPLYPFLSSGTEHSSPCPVFRKRISGSNIFLLFDSFNSTISIVQ